MRTDILDQPRVGILQTVTHFLLVNGPTSFKEILDRLSGTQDGRDYLRRNALGLLESINLIKKSDDHASLNNCDILENTETDLYSPKFETNFKVQLLNKISNCEEPHIAYFVDALRKLFDTEIFDDPKLEQILRQTRRDRGIQVSEGEQLSGKIQFCKSLLKELNLVIAINDIYYICINNDILHRIFELAISYFDKTQIKIYSELLPHVDQEYLPVLNREEGRLLNSIVKIFSPSFAKSFGFDHVSDGGRPIRLGENEYNVILKK